jgi:hypothetical protein
MEVLASRRRAGLGVLRQRIATGRLSGKLAPGTDIDALAGMVTDTLSGLAMLTRD